MIKKIILLSFLISLFLTIGYFVLAAKTEINYPTLPGGISINPNSTKPLFSQYIKYAFSLAIWISGLIVFISLIQSGVKYVLSAGNPGAASDAKEGIGAAILGLVVLLSSYILLITINPQLVLTQPTISANWGITLYSSSDCPEGGVEGENFLQITKSTELKLDISETVHFTVSSIKFTAPPGSLELNLISTDNETELVNNDMAQCVNVTLPSIKFIEFHWRLPGVNLVNANGVEKNVPNSVALLDSEFNDKVVGIIFRSLGQPTKFGAVLHEAQNYSERCKVYIEEGSVNFTNDCRYGDKDQTCLNEVPENTSAVLSLKNPQIGVSSVTVFTPDKRTEYDDEGVTFYNAANYQDPMLQNLHGGIYRSIKDAGGTDNAATSMRINGRYIVILFAEEDFQAGCEVFTKSDPNFRDDQIGKCKCVTGWWCHDCLSSFMIIPVK